MVKNALNGGGNVMIRIVKLIKKDKCLVSLLLVIDVNAEIKKSVKIQIAIFNTLNKKKQKSFRIFHKRPILKKTFL